MSRPWMPLYVADYLADTCHLTTLEHGAYLLLIMHYWQRGQLPNDDARLCSIAKASLEQWLSIKPVIAELFDDGWRHRRIDEELEKSRIAYEKRALAGKKGGLAARESRSNASSNASGIAGSNAEAITSQSQSSNEDIILSEPLVADPIAKKSRRTRKSYPDAFQQFWKAYPTDPLMSKPIALKAWEKLSDEDQLKAIQTIPAFRAYCVSNSSYRPVHACRYISERRFDGFATTTETVSAIQLVVVEQHSPAGRAWEAHYRETKGRGVPWTNGCWRFPTEYPCEERVAAE